MPALRLGSTMNVKMPRTSVSAARGVFRRELGKAGKAVTNGITFTTNFRTVHVLNAKAQRRIDNAARVFLYRFGGYVRSTARREIGRNTIRRKWEKDKVWWNGKRYKSWRYSTAGNAPKSHTKLLKNNIFFKPEVRQLNVVIGPIPRGTRIAGLLEHGGSQNIYVAWKRSKSGRLIISRDKKYLKRKTIKYAPRPYMRPAFTKVIYHPTAGMNKLLRDMNIPSTLKDIFYQRGQASAARYGR